MARQEQAGKQAAQWPAERTPSEKEAATISGQTCGLLSDLYQFQIDLCRLVRRQRDFACFRKIFPQGFRIGIFEPVRMIHRKNLVGARGKKGELKTAGRIGGLHSGRCGGMLRKCQDRGGPRLIFQRYSPAEESRVIAERDLDGLRRGARSNGQVGSRSAMTRLSS